MAQCTLASMCRTRRTAPDESQMLPIRSARGQFMVESVCSQLPQQTCDGDADVVENDDDMTMFGRIPDIVNHHVCWQLDVVLAQESA
eukprot:4086412-Amphidinium_carterae.1